MTTADHLNFMETYTASSSLEPLLSIEQLAEYLGVPVTTIYDWRVDGKGPRGVRVSRYVKFAASDVREWVAQQREPEPGHSDAGHG
ncbi:helix-turn-helix transcriptional regulator [Promicromonospora panici]|uniref:helix-turn-helix transcriptional regulator n=1 Tax=Promicromonospora panici TaxID=2219658 RepID=UPI001F5DD11E|nr:helix-turn-helix domain-containing protein [Promicromonospora panici]